MYNEYIQSKVRGRFRKILWPSQNIWTLKIHTSSSPYNLGVPVFRSKMDDLVATGIIFQISLFNLSRSDRRKQAWKKVIKWRICCGKIQTQFSFGSFDIQGRTMGLNYLWTLFLQLFNFTQFFLQTFRKSTFYIYI